MSHVREADHIYQFGFKWGPMWVTRIARLGTRGRVLQVRTDHRKIEVFVSDKGRSIRVWRDGKELT